MRIFVTGGSGFVGQNVIPVLIKAGHDIHALVRSETSAKKVEKLGCTPVLDDLLQLSSNTENTLKKCDAVLHAAAHMDFTYDQKPYYEMNVKATKQLVQLAKSAGIKKFIYISAAPVAANKPAVNLKEAEVNKKLPLELYPKTKAIAEEFVLNANTTNFQTISLRPPAIWGPNNHHYEDLFANAKKGKWRWIGGSHQILSTIHVLNLANAVLAALKSDIGGEAFFVTDGDRRSMRTTFGSIMKAYDIDPGEKELPRSIAVFMSHLFGGIWKIVGLKSRPPVAPLMIRLMATEFSVDDTKARTMLGYENAITFTEGIADLKNDDSF